MATSPFHIAELITAYLRDTLSPEQRAEFDKWLELDANKHFLEDFTEKDNFREKLAQFAGINAEITWNKTLTRLDKISSIKASAKTPLANRFKLYKYKWIARVAAAAAICFGIYFFSPFNNRIFQGNGGNRNLVVNDVAPGTKGATLTLADGKTIELSGNKNGVVANASNITYDDGTPVDPSLRKGTMKQSHPDAMLLASTANGRTYIFTLPDGTKVWLNAASSIKFPSTFSGERRKVEISGEVYLEVIKDEAHPFVVISKDQELEVLGTHFNIRSYLEETSTKTTLLEGSVKLTPLLLSQNSNSSLRGATTSQSEVVLKPNEQSVLKGGKIKVQSANTDMETAWIKNDFYFRGEKLENVLRDVSRWYDVTVSYSNEEIKSIPLIGQISRTKSLSAVLERIASAGRTRFKIEGKHVTVMPDNN